MSECSICGSPDGIECIYPSGTDMESEVVYSHLCMKCIREIENETEK